MGGGGRERRLFLLVADKVLLKDFPAKYIENNWSVNTMTKKILTTEMFMFFLELLNFSPKSAI